MEMIELANKSSKTASKRRTSFATRAGALVDKHMALFFAGPAVVLLILMIVAPLIYALYLSFHSWAGGVGEPIFIGVDNYTRLFTDSRFLGGLVRTVLFAGIAVSLQTILGVSIALILNRKFRGRRLVQSLLLLPVIATPVAVALVWRLMYQPDLGILNDILGLFGLPPSNWVADSSMSLFLVAIVDVWQWTGFIILITLATLVALPRWPYEAAAVDGANAWQILWHITLPLIRPVVIAAVVFRSIDALKTFDLILVITGGGPGQSSETIDLYAYRSIFEYLELGYSSAMLVIFFIFIGVCSWLISRLRSASK